jgi:hypothetical protein
MTATVLTFPYTGGLQTLIVPPGITALQVECWGAQGSGGANPGGKGGYVKGNLTTNPGETLNLYVGGGGFGGGGGGTGGGATDIRQGGTALGNRQLVAGGGGSGSYEGSVQSGTYNPANLAGGFGGYAAGQPGFGIGGGGAGTQTNGGAAGASDNVNLTGTAGTLGQGGVGRSGNGSGGGGYYGGGGGSGYGSNPYYGGGGGGSSYFGGSNITSASHASGTRTGNGLMVITFLTGDSVGILIG